jgi:uncharacterized protein YukE
MNTTPEDTAKRTDADTAKTVAADLGEEAKETARALGEEVAGKARARAEGVKDGVASEFSSISDALRRASDELRDGSPQERTFGAAADAIADFADSMRDRDLGQMVDELSDFARRNPIGFLGGAALLGFAGTRLAKASRRDRVSQGDRSMPTQFAGGATSPRPAGHATSSGSNSFARSRIGETS